MDTHPQFPTPRRTRRRRLATLGSTLVLISVLSACSTSPDADPTLDEWLSANAVPLSGVEVALDDSDLSAVDETVGDASIVGLGEAAHGVAELTSLRHRVVQHLVEDLGFRTIAWEDDWSLGTQIDEYLQGDRDDLDALLGKMTAEARTNEIGSVIEWLRSYNDSHPDDSVRFFGTEYFATQPFVYDALKEYVAAHAPKLTEQARAHVSFLRPTTENMGDYLRWYYTDVTDKQPYIDLSEKLYELVSGISSGDTEADANAEHAARQVRSWYAAFAMQDNAAFRDARVAENISWRHDLDGEKTIYWAASAHTAVAPDVTIAFPPDYETTFASAGSILDAQYGDDYVSIGFTYSQGSVLGGEGSPVDVTAPADEWFERPLVDVDLPQFLIDLRGETPGEVSDWLNAPFLTRGDPAAGAESTMSGGTASEWFDAVVHRQNVTPTTPIAQETGQP
jgi:erythromycin esterase